MHQHNLRVIPPFTPPPAAVVEPALNEPNYSINGCKTVLIDALLDYRGLTVLEEHITALKALLVDQGADDYAI